MLELKKVSIAYKDKQVLQNLSLTAKKGEIIGLVAPNGTGKTTLFKVISHSIKPDSGKVTVDKTYSYQSEKQQVAIHKQLTTFPDQSELFAELTGMDHLKLYADMWKGTRTHIPTLTASLKMDHYVKKKVKTYSLGMRQRLCFAMMVAADTKIMLLDEVMNGLDVENVAIISKQLLDFKQQDKLVFVASHLLENLDLYADRVLYLRDGQFIHEQRFHEKQSDYIKVGIKKDQYDQLCAAVSLPDNHVYLANRLLCIPFDVLSAEQQTEWIQRLLEYKGTDLTIGPLGTLEYYEKFYA
ncbi:ABC transporter ATP-binding protein [Alkalicoccobacillus porphyridii]|uniref:ATP-binding cassette domain-containing protein n=1 Tax=Alkalicoccobacillus porphyridii TaxID=2597270 RepID=A0A554A0Z7_9BACI|nr:ATP-binding cassette domain-containing protein [Alkalicoccobacillus porphyridii]TSB47353.1 ATP-binding cassette domain-containing protein [Alkalicoccobacillus porphyridii]